MLPQLLGHGLAEGLAAPPALLGGGLVGFLWAWGDPPFGRVGLGGLFAHAEAVKDALGDVLPEGFAGEFPQGGHGLLHIGEQGVRG